MVVREDRRISRVLRVVTQDLTRRWTLADAADIAGIERAYFAKVFRKTTGDSFAQWNARIRVEHAKSLLNIVDMSITAVATSVGYEDVTTFERVFRRIEKVSPRQYRAGSSSGAT